MLLRQLCEERTNLTPQDIELLESIEKVLPFTADITAGDMFIDVMNVKDNRMFAVAQARSQWEYSAYCGSTIGLPVLRENEPAVYHAYESGVPVRDLKAVTQENKTVKQDVVPIQNSNDVTIGVLICEKDISRSILRDKKYQALVREKEDGNELITPSSNSHNTSKTATREIHHRVKNNLQMVASLLNLQARKTNYPEVRRAFNESTSRVLSIAAIHDILTGSESDEMINIKPLLEKISDNVQSLINSEREIILSVLGDNFKVSPDKATSIAMIVNELVTNSIEHGFIGKANDVKGIVKITIQKGQLYSTITVEDNGIGFDVTNTGSHSLGLNIVTQTLKDKLGGKLRLSSGNNGTRAMFDFMM